MQSLVHCILITSTNEHVKNDDNYYAFIIWFLTYSNYILLISNHSLLGFPKVWQSSAPSAKQFVIFIWDDMLLRKKSDNCFSTNDLVMTKEDFSKALSKHLIYKVSWKSFCVITLRSQVKMTPGLCTFNFGILSKILTRQRTKMAHFKRF